jgi:hypothetical protein
VQTLPFQIQTTFFVQEIVSFWLITQLATASVTLGNSVEERLLAILVKTQVKFVSIQQALQARSKLP